MQEQCLVMWLNIALNEEFITQYDSHTIKCLTLVSRSIARVLKGYVEQNYWFDLSSEIGRRVTYYSPTNQKKVMDVSEILPSAKKVEFHNHFNKEVDNVLPHSITHLNLGNSFNTRIRSLPPSIVNLRFGKDFKHSLDHILLPNLTHLAMGIRFNSSVDHMLLPNLTHLTLSFFFRQPINHLPPNLIVLKLGYWFNEFIQSLPPKTRLVTFGKMFQHPVDHLSKDIQFQKSIYNLKSNAYDITPYQYQPQ